MSAALHAAIAAVCPIDGVSIADPADRATWRIDFRPGATQEQRDAAANIVASFNLGSSTANDVRSEAQRRIIALVGATDMTSCIIKQLNANMRANELNDIRHGREWTTEEAAEATVLRALADKIKAIRAASNVMEPSPPADYTADSHWPA